MDYRPLSNSPLSLFHGAAASESARIRDSKYNPRARARARVLIEISVFALGVDCATGPQPAKSRLQTGPAFWDRHQRLPPPRCRCAKSRKALTISDLAMWNRSGSPCEGAKNCTAKARRSSSSVIAENPVGFLAGG